MDLRFGAVFATMLAFALWCSPASAQERMQGPPPQANVYSGLMAEGFTPVDASAGFDPASLVGATVAIIPSANFNEYTRRWVYFFDAGNVERSWSYRLAGMTRDSLRSQEQNSDPRGFADQLVALIEPHVGAVIVATDFQDAREQGATYYLIVDAWFGSRRSFLKTWAGAYLLDSSLQQVFESQRDYEVRAETGGFFDSVSEALARSMRASYEGATQPVLDAVGARLESGPTAPTP